MKRYLIILFLIAAAGCSNANKNKANFVEQASEYNRTRIKFKDQVDSNNYNEYADKSKQLLQKVRDLPAVEDWSEGDSLRFYLTKTLQGDIAYYESLGKKDNTGSLDEQYNQLNFMSRNLAYEIRIMELLIDEKQKLLDEEK